MNINHSRLPNGRFCTYAEGDKALAEEEAAYWYAKAKKALQQGDKAEARRCMAIRSDYLA